MHDKIYDFKDISLVPRIISNIQSRDNVDTSINFCGIKLKLPIIASPMLDVVDAHVCEEMARTGGLGILHRFCTIDKQCQDFITVFNNRNCICGAAIGLVQYKNELERFQKLYNLGCRIFVIDTANAANENVLDCIRIIDHYNGVHFIVGNVASGENFQTISSWKSVAGVRLGIAGGSACTTKNSTGVYNGQVNILQECKKSDSSVLKIIDGGIREPQDFCKAISLGADAVMLGSIIAACKDSSAETQYVGCAKPKYKKFRGSASYQIQEEYKEPKYIEGQEIYLEYKEETIHETMLRFLNGLRSSMSYFGAKNIEEYRKNVTIMYNK